MIFKSKFNFCLMFFCGCLAFSLAACGDDDTASASAVKVEKAPGEDVQYNQPQSVVVINGETYVVTNDDQTTDCIQIENECVDISDAKGKYCDQDGAQADVVVVDGDVVGLICYPPPEDAKEVIEVTPDSSGNVEVPQSGNGTVITFDEGTNGKPMEGNIVIDAERAIIYGNGPDETIIDGNLTLNSNNARVRGVTVMGNLELSSNNVAASFCEVHGNFIATGNGFTAVECQVFGNVIVSGNNGILVNIGVQGNWEVTGNGTICDGCYSFEDKNDNFDMDQTPDDDDTSNDEITGDLVCSGKK